MAEAVNYGHFTFKKTKKQVFSNSNPLGGDYMFQMGLLPQKKEWETSS